MVNFAKGLWLNSGPCRVLSEKCLSKWCLLVSTGNCINCPTSLSLFLHLLSLIGKGKAYPFYKQKMVRGWNKISMYLGNCSIISSQNHCKWLFLCRNNCPPAFQNTKAGFAFVHKMWFGEFGEHTTTYLHNQMANCNLF